MNKEKQIIDEMSEEIQNAVNGCSSYWSGLIAEHLYEKDYRKQSEGEWGFDGMSWTCSECGEYATKGIKTSFCPNCGAHMKGGAE